MLFKEVITFQNYSSSLHAQCVKYRGRCVQTCARAPLLKIMASPIISSICWNSASALIVCNVPSICNTLDVVVTLPCPLASGSLSMRSLPEKLIIYIKSCTKWYHLNDRIDLYDTSRTCFEIHWPECNVISPTLLYPCSSERLKENPSVYRARPQITDDRPVRRLL